MDQPQGEPGPIARYVKRHLPFADNVGKKDRKGNPINLTIYEGRILSPNQPEYFKLSREAEVRPDDIFVCGYAKTGCHWIWETLSMIRKGKAEFSRMGKCEAFLESAEPELYNSLPSPRVLNTHNMFDWLPPKEEVYNYHGEFPDWFELFLEGYVDNGEYFDYHLHWLQAMKNNPDHPILVVKYEDVQEDYIGTIRKLAEFIDTPLSKDLVQRIALAASFEGMKKHYEGGRTSIFLRKGTIGDWKNWLTDDQSAELDRRSEKLKGTVFEPQYEN